MSAAPTWNSEEAIKFSIQQYHAQYTETITAIAQVEQHRAGLDAQKNTIVGAIAALEQLLKNGENEKANAGAQPVGTVVTPPEPSATS